MVNERMTREEFITQLKEDLLAGKGHSLLIETVLERDIEKLQGESYKALQIKVKDSNVGPSISVENGYQAVTQGVAYEDVYHSLVQYLEEAFEQIPTVEVQVFNDYEKVKEGLGLEIVGIEKNQEMLKNIPYEKMEDLAIVYRFYLDEDKSALITNQMMERLHIDQKTLHEDALAVAPDRSPAFIFNIKDLIPLPQEMDDMSENAVPMFVAMAGENAYGASVIAYPNFLDKVAEQLEGDFYIIPSSIAEVIMIPDDGSRKSQELGQMIEEVNENNVLPEQQLSQNPYHYDSKNKIFELAADYESKAQMFDLSGKVYYDKIALSIPEGYFVMQKVQEGYNFMLYDNDFKDVESSVLTDPDKTIFKALKEVMDKRNLSIADCKSLNYEKFNEKMMAVGTERKSEEKTNGKRRESVLSALKERQEQIRIKEKTQSSQHNNHKKREEQSI